SAQISASVKQYRRDELRRVVQVTITNRGTTPIAVEQIGLKAQGYVPTPPAAGGASIQPGDRVDLPVQLGAGKCGDSGTTPAATPSAGPVVVTARVRPAAGSAAEDVELVLPRV